MWLSFVLLALLGTLASFFLIVISPPQLPLACVVSMRHSAFCGEPTFGGEEVTDSELNALPQAFRAHFVGGRERGAQLYFWHHGQVKTNIWGSLGEVRNGNHFLC
jgi:hypothetical protein